MGSRPHISSAELDPVITIQDVATAHEGLAALRFCLQKLPRTSEPRVNARRLADQAAVNAGLLRVMAAHVPDPRGHRAEIEAVAEQLEALRAETINLS